VCVCVCVREREREREHAAALKAYHLYSSFLWPKFRKFKCLKNSNTCTIY